MVFNVKQGDPNASYLEIQYAQTTQCTDPVNNLINPYYSGVKGNWRPMYNYAYQVNRVKLPGSPNQAGGTNVRYSGYYNTYAPFWNFSNGVMTPIAPVVNGNP